MTGQPIPRLGASISYSFVNDYDQLLVRMSDGTVVLAGLALLYDANGNPLLSTPSADALAPAGLLASAPLVYNGATFDRTYNNTPVTLLPSAARTATLATPTQTSPNHRGLVLFVNITALAGTTPSLTPQILAVDPVSGTTLPIWAGAALTAVGLSAYLLYPGAAGGSYTGVAGIVVPRAWQANFVVAGTTPSVTFSAGATLLV